MGQQQFNCSIKEQTIVEVFYSEESKVFYVKTVKHHVLEAKFKNLINCRQDLFNEFLKYLSQFTNPEEPASYSYEEMEKSLSLFLLKRANCKVSKHVEFTRA
ncbi:hypothetical protein V2647_14645 [Tenacibaculum maritimum]|uniref:hypothetical protein n=1 Tax=Tenacibaculum maritimum TaxID=107401 RepID=UPI0038775916